MTGQDAADRQGLERLALAGWSEAAAARGESVTVASDRAEVALVVNGDYGYWTYFQRDGQCWYETVTGSAPTTGWDDPGFIVWGGP